MTAALKPAIWLILYKLRITCPQIFLSKPGTSIELKPGVSMIYVPSFIGIISECLVVCFPRSIFSLICPVSICTSSCRQLMIDDLPTPEGPATVVVLPSKMCFISSMPSPVFVLVKALYSQPARICF